MADQIRHGADFLIGNQGIQSKVNLNATDVAVFHRILQCFRGKVFRALPCVKGTAAQVNGIGAVLNRRPEGFHRARRCQ